MRAARPDPATLVAGLAILVLGALLLLDAFGVLELTFGLFGPVACAAAGAILLANGLSGRQ